MCGSRKTSSWFKSIFFYTFCIAAIASLRQVHIVVFFTSLFHVLLLAYYQISSRKRLFHILQLPAGVVLYLTSVGPAFMASIWISNHFFKIDLIVFQFYRPVHDIASLGGTWTYEIYDRYVFEWLQHTAPYVWSTLDRMFGFS